MILLKIIQNLTKVNFVPAENRKIEYLVIHYFGALGSAKNTSDYFKDVNRKASAHYFVDDDSIYQSVRDKDIAWHCGDKGVGTYKKKCSNANSLGIEVRPYKIDTKSMLAGDRDWYFTDKTVLNTIDLVKCLMHKYKIPVENVIRHYDVTGKFCPRPFVGNDENILYKKTGDELWKHFKMRVGSKEESEVTQEEFNQKMKVYLDNLKVEQPSEWSEEYRAWAEKLGLIQGDENGNLGYKLPVTKEQMVAFMKRLSEVK